MDQRTLARFMGNVTVRLNGCWHLPPRQKDGYATFWLSGKYQLAHRTAYEHFVGAIPDGLVIDHRCHTEDLSCPGGGVCQHRRCVNPNHLEPVTSLENNLRGRSPFARNAAKGACIRGHAFSAENTYLAPGGGRECRTCRDARSKEWMRTHNPGVRHGAETHCPQGHPYEGENLVITVNGGRACRECKRDWNRGYMRAKRARAKAAKAE